MTQLTPKILVVDDEQDLCDILQFNLKAAGYDVVTALSAEDALLALVQTGKPDLILLDVMLGGMSGFELAQRLRNDEATKDLPVVFLTAKDTEDDTLKGFSLGADDYISKPFSIREVMVRIMAVLRRTSVAVHAEASQAHVLEYQSLVLNTDNKKVSVDGREIAFTRIEYELLELLLKERGHVFSRADLIQQVWPSDVLVLDRTVDVNMARIRKKIGRYASNIVTRQGFGYYFEE